MKYERMPAYRVQTDRIDRTVDHLLKALEHQDRAIKHILTALVAELVCIGAVAVIALMGLWG